MNAIIALFLLQDGIINGAIYAMLGVTIVLIFAVTRVIFVPQGEFAAWGALTLAAIEAGTVPGTARLLLVLGIAAACTDILRERATLDARKLLVFALRDVGVPAALLILCMWMVPQKPPLWIGVVMTLALLVPMGPLI